MADEQAVSPGLSIINLQAQIDLLNRQVAAVKDLDHFGTGADIATLGLSALAERRTKKKAVKNLGKQIEEAETLLAEQQQLLETIRLQGVGSSVNVLSFQDVLAAAI